MRKIGFSHGVLFKIHEAYTKENIQLFTDCGCTALEINCHSIQDIDSFDSIYPYLNNFERLSIHLPSSIRYKNNEETRNVLKRIENFYFKINAQLAVVHPDVVDDWEVFNEFKIDLGVENMDDRKKIFREVSDFKNFFAVHKDFGLVLDLGHCNINDKSMVLADDFINEFKNKIKEIHLSGYEVFHDPLYRTKQLEIIKRCRDLNVPIIIESTFELSDGTEGVKKEFDYIIENLK
jgi:hypothetical protein